MPFIIDFHTHVYPNPLERFTGQKTVGDFHKKAKNTVKSLRHWAKPFSNSIHEFQTFLRIIPESIRKPIEEIGVLAPALGLLLESSASDLKSAMSESGVDYAVLIAHPPYFGNDVLLELCQDNPQFIGAVNIPVGTPQPGSALKNFHKKGARLLKIHPASDGEGVDSARYKTLLNAADDLGIPVILHTGCVHSRFAFKDSEQGRVQKFIPWFEKYKNTAIVLAHMNSHEPDIALDLAERFPHLRVDTSWQPSESIGEAVRRIGAERVLFGSDWPLVGNNIAVGMTRIEDCVQMGMINSQQSRQILGTNAQTLLGIPDAS